MAKATKATPKRTRKRKPKTIKLNLGGGATEIPGYINIDRKFGKEAFPLAYPAESVDVVRASHLLEHFPHGLTEAVLADWVRVLKPGGTLKIAVPDADKIIVAYQSRQPGMPIEGWLFGGQTDENDFHFCMWTRSKLWSVLHGAGLRDIVDWRSKIQDCATLPISLNLQGTKPPVGVDVPGIETKLSVKAVMSVPRLGFMANFFSMFQTLLPLGIDIKMLEGAYWHQALEDALTDIVESTDAEAVLTVDYDTVCVCNDLRTMMRLMLEHPEIDALCPIQMKRHGESPLITIRQKDGQMAKAVVWETLEPATTRIHTGHFGLTLLRTAALRTLPHPWFLPVANKHGRWGKDHLDADIYFWHNWSEHGKTLHLANHVPIGHCELMVTWPDRNFKATYQHIEKFGTGGKPEDIWQ